MKNIIKHIGINVVENDIETFYIDLLEGTIIKTFKLNPEIVSKIFNYNQEIELIVVKYDTIEFELFLHSMRQFTSFSHICIQSYQAEKIAKKAKNKGFPSLTLQNNNKESYFISDHNYNLFEIKQL